MFFVIARIHKTAARAAATQDDIKVPSLAAVTTEAPLTRTKEGHRLINSSAKL